MDLNFQDALGQWHNPSKETIDAVLHAMRVDPHAEAPEESYPMVVLRAGETRSLPRPAMIRLETGETIHAEKRLPRDLPLGYHLLQYEEDAAVTPSRLIVSPGACWLPDNLETWGWAIQLYATRSRASWGIGDFSDLEQLARWSAGELGSGMMLLNPLSAATPITPQQASPYYPASRRFFNPLWLHIEWVPGATELPELESLAKTGRDLNRERLIDRNKVFALKMRALDLLWSEFTQDDVFSAYCREHGADLDRFATFCALAEQHQCGWNSWPAPYRHPENAEVARFARDHPRRVEFHKWLQWLIDRQLARSSRHLAVMQDLPIGVDPDGADAWAWQDIFTPDVAIGAPPDEFTTQGQNWGLPPFIPEKLRAAGYEPFIQTIRAAFRNGGGLRIDHVMGLFRLFWIPRGMSAAQGTYVRYNADEMLAIVALESHRARAYVVGEDLGTVEDEVRERLALHRVMSYRLLWFEKENPATYPREALAAITTHDLPTVTGLWTGSDLKRQRELRLEPNEESTAEIHQRLSAIGALEPDSPIEEVIARSYSVLARAPSRLLTAALDDALAVEERPNIPATTCDQNPNWSLALPEPIEDLMTRELPLRIAAELRRSNP